MYTYIYIYIIERERDFGCGPRHAALRRRAPSCCCLYAYRQRSWGPRCKPQTDYKPHEEEKGDCIPYVRSIPVKRERRIIARPSTKESSTERTDKFLLIAHHHRPNSSDIELLQSRQMQRQREHTTLHNGA